MRLYSLLIADDNRLARQGLAKLVDWKSLGFQVDRTFGDGKQVIEYLSERQADVVLTDIRMSVVSGLDVARWIAENGRNTAVVLISAYREFEYARQAIETGVVHYLLKPLDLAEVSSVFGQLRNDLDGKWARQDSAATTTKETDVVSRAEAYIEAHIDEGLGLHDVAESVGLSDTHLSRLFRARRGNTFISYLMAAKIRRATELLARTDMKVYEISRAMGYRDLSHFHRVFRQQIGTSPGAYRRSVR